MITICAIDVQHVLWFSIIPQRTLSKMKEREKDREGNSTPRMLFLKWSKATRSESPLLILSSIQNEFNFIYLVRQPSSPTSTSNIMQRPWTHISFNISSFSGSLARAEIQHFYLFKFSTSLNFRSFDSSLLSISSSNSTTLLLPPVWSKILFISVVRLLMPLLLPPPDLLLLPLSTSAVQHMCKLLDGIPNGLRHIFEFCPRPSELVLSSSSILLRSEHSILPPPCRFRHDLYMWHAFDSLISYFRPAFPCLEHERQHRRRRFYIMIVYWPIDSHASQPTLRQASGRMWESLWRAHMTMQMNM